VKTPALQVKKHIDRFRHSLAGIDALPQLTLIGVIVGLCSGILIVAFRLLIDVPLEFFLPSNAENFEALSSIQHFLLPFIGSIILGLCFYYLPKKFHDTSVGNVLERLHNHQGKMPLGNLLVQFFGGALCLLSGQSVGREGPAVHIGASAASLLGQWFKLPNNSLRTLVGCGVAAAIAASFNTPVAGVIFAMEVVLMSYSIVGFIPVMMASVCGALVTRLVFGEEFFFSVTDFQMYGLWELLIMVIAGFIIGIIATLYMRLQLSFHRFTHYPIAGRIMAAGLVTGCIAIFVPEILGLGYDTVNLALEGKLALSALCIILFAKLIATAFSISMGLPGGLIGPQLFMGACIGAIIGSIMNTFYPDSVSHTGFYVLLGMAAMMGAVINAPLAALMAVLELAYNPSIIFPSMLVIVISCVTTRQLFKCEGIFIEQLAANGKSLDSSPTQQILSNIGVHSVMKTAFSQCSTSITLNTATQLLSNNPLWIVVTHDTNEMTLLRAADLASFLSESAEHSGTVHLIDLLEIPGERLDLSPIHELATLYEAQQILTHQQTDALYVTSNHASVTPNTGPPQILGIITRNTIDNHYKV
jgi:H+/Cl- antiporter ClcA